MTIEHLTIALLARRMWQEARKVEINIGNPMPAQQRFGSAVGMCLRNRVSRDAPWLYVLARSISSQIVMEPTQAHDPLLLWAIWEAEAIYQNQKPDTTNGATNWSFIIQPEGENVIAWPGFYTYSPKLLDRMALAV